MKAVAALLYRFSVIALMIVAAGCVATMRTQDLLSAANFKIVPATTPEQQAQLKALPAHKVTMVQRNGKEYFVYPDASQHVFYVGQNAEYQQYQRLREQSALAQEELTAATMDADWDVWGSGVGPGWWSPLSP